MKGLKLIFMGTPDFAVPALIRLTQAGHAVAGVFTQPDKPVGRKQILTPPAVKVQALSLGIPVYQPASLKTGEAEEIIRNIRPDAIVVAAYGKILPKSILDIPPLGCINIHGSLLPKYRGAAPIQHAILHGEAETGITTMLMNEGLDTGDILEQSTLTIGENETSGELFDRMAALGGELILSTLAKLAEGSLIPMPQNHEEATYAPPLCKGGCEIDWSRPALEIHNQIRALNPWPVAGAVLDGKPVRIFSSRLTEETSTPGAIACSKQGFSIACGDGVMLRILEIQPQGGKRMSAAAFLCGCRGEVNCVF